MNDGALHNELVTALRWYLEQGVTDIVQDDAVDRTVVMETSQAQHQSQMTGFSESSYQDDVSVATDILAQARNVQTPAFLGKSDAYEEAVKLARQANSLEELAKAIAEFEGISIKKSATNLVFADGFPQADIMVIGEAPGADEDRLGKPFVGVQGQLLDKILACIGLDRKSEDPKTAVYLSNILNWRPPGNRSPSPAEIEVSLPFIERHIQLVNPKILILCGGVPAQSLLGSSQSISRLRKSWHEYKPQTKDIGTDLAKEDAPMIQAIATYHPAQLLRTPVQKKHVWNDMLFVQEKLLSLH